MNSLKLDENQLIENFEAKLAKNEMIEPKIGCRRNTVNI